MLYSYIDLDLEGIFVFYLYIGMWMMVVMPDSQLSIVIIIHMYGVVISSDGDD